MLLGYANAALPSDFSGASPSIQAASCVFSSDGFSTTAASVSVSKIEYYFPFPAGDGSYHIEWDEVTYNNSGGTGTPVTTVHKTFTWDGVVPPGYNPADSSTWPKTSEYVVGVPAGATMGNPLYTMVENVVATC